jgi:tetratricopeptide (TPR) repeat protein
VGDQADPNAIRLAASALVASDPAIKDLLPLVGDAWQKATTDEARLNLALLLAYGYRTAEDAPHLKEIASGILKEYPDSYTAMDLLGSASGMLKEWDAWKEMLDSRLTKRPDDEELLRLKASWAEERGDWAESRSVRQMLMDKGTAKPNDYNMYGWSALFDNTVNDAAIKAARQATMMTNNASFSEIHTLACLYAAEGKTTEARDLLLKAMNMSNLSMPNSAVWYGFGSIYEQYGINDAAAQAYSKVEKPQGRISATSTYLLAKSRLKILESSGATANNAGHN